MRTLFWSLLLAATAASPALADKGGHGHGGGHGDHGGGGWKHEGGGGEGHGGWKHGGGDEGGGWRHGGGEGHGGWKHEARGEWHGEKHGWVRQAWFAPPPRFGLDDGKWARKAWKREAKEERRWARNWERRERYRPTGRYAYVQRYAPVRYAEPAQARYVEQNYAPAYDATPVQSWSRSYRPTSSYDYMPTSYGEPVGYASDDWPNDYGALGYGDRTMGLFGSGGTGLFGTLLPVLLQGATGGNLGLGGLTGLSGFGGYESPDVYPLQLASYAPYSSYGSGTGDFASMLLPSLLGNGSLF